MIANYFINHELEQGTKIVCIDLGNSFKKFKRRIGHMGYDIVASRKFFEMIKETFL